MALPAFREKNIAPARFTPTITSSVAPRKSADANGSSKISTSASSGRIIGAIGGRNGPVLNTTVAKSHTALGERLEKGSASPIRAARSPRLQNASPRVDDRQQELHRSPRTRVMLTQDIERDINGAHHASTSYDNRPIGATKVGGMVDNTFEAQMERALASGANPFQDRKRDQMRSDSRLATKQGEEHGIGNLQRSREPTPKKKTMPTKPLISSPPARIPLAIMNRESPRMSSPKVKELPVVVSAPSQSPGGRKVLASPTRAEVLNHEIQCSEAVAKAEEAKREVLKVKKELQERVRNSDMQMAQIKDLERRVTQWKAKAKEASTIQLDTSGYLWEAERRSCRESIARAEESRERAIEALINQNEVSCMDSRRAETELDLELCRLEVNSIQRLLKDSEKSRREMRKIVDADKAKGEEIFSRLEVLEANESNLQSLLKREQERSTAFEDVVENLKSNVSSNGCVMTSVKWNDRLISVPLMIACQGTRTIANIETKEGSIAV
jgi:hypothetical protein